MQFTSRAEMWSFQWLPQTLLLKQQNSYMEVKKNKKDKNDILYKYAVIYIGTIFMMVSPFFIDSNEGKIGMLIGLALITIQTQKTKQYNLSLLNLVGFCGYLFSLIKNL